MKTLEQKRDEAVIRQQAYDSLTTAQKIERLDRAFGVGKGAAKERARLLAPKVSLPLTEALLAGTSPELPEHIKAEVQKMLKKVRGKPSRRNLNRAAAEEAKKSKE